MRAYEVTATTTNMVNPLRTITVPAINPNKAMDHASEIITSEGDRLVRFIAVK